MLTYVIRREWTGSDFLEGFASTERKAEEKTMDHVRNGRSVQATLLKHRQEIVGSETPNPKFGDSNLVTSFRS
jgi:hypothetical protein